MKVTMQTSFLTFAIPFDQANRGAVEDALDKLGNPTLHNHKLEFGEKSLNDALNALEIVHFMSGSVIPGDPGEKDHLLLEMTIDGEEKVGLDLFDNGLNKIVGPVVRATGSPINGPLSLFLKPIRVGTGLFDVPGLNFTGTPGLTKTRIWHEWQLARVLRTHFDKNPPTGDALADLQRARDCVRAAKTPDLPSFAHLLKPEPTLLLQPAADQSGLTLSLIAKLAVGAAFKFLWPAMLAGVLIGALVATLSPSSTDLVAVGSWAIGCAVAATIVAAALVYGLLRHQEQSDVPDNTIPDQKTLIDVVSNENGSGVLQNHLTGVSRIKPGWLRQLTLRAAFWLIGQVATRIYRPGYLGELGTIHSARWVALPGTDKLIFLSNYGGSWESYLEDFITKASSGLTAVWSNTVGYPRTRSLLFEGASDGDRFKRWARRQQIPTRFWYSANFQATTARIRTNAAIRAGLGSASTVDEAKAFLSLFGSRTTNDSIVEKAEVQALVASGLGGHPHASFLAIGLPEARSDAKNWLEGVRLRIAHADTEQHGTFLQIALAPSGLIELGMLNEELEEFALPFRMGMSWPHRSRYLGDTGRNLSSPKDWEWGGPEKPVVHAVLMVYAQTPDELETAVRDELHWLGECKGSILHKINTHSRSDGEAEQSGDGFPRERFGFADGISQPIVRGLHKRAGFVDDQHVVQPGEFILGYRDNRGYRVDAPTVAATRDPQNLLAVAGAQHAKTAYPSFDASGANARRMVGDNGSYLVIRQLEQQPEMLDKYLDNAAQAIASCPAVSHLSDARRKEYIAAKMVGRWKDGSSLVRNPHQPASGWPDQPLDVKVEPDNDFTFGAEDPLGEACPFGAHIRRANPRDSQTPGSKEQIDITNRHRILRRGRFFYKSDSDHLKDRGPLKASGLFFMCLNADIERQFEFVQQTWIMAEQFHGLENEVDPILVRGVNEDGGQRMLARLTIPTPQGPIQLSQLPRIVNTKGGGYFFMPSRRMLKWLASSV